MLTSNGINERAADSVVMNKNSWEKNYLLGEREIHTYSNGQKEKYREFSTKLRDVFGINPTTRYFAVGSLSSLLSSEKFSYIVLRGDIQHFFDNVDTNKISARIREKTILTRSEDLALKNILFDSTLKGLPQGNPAASMLAEIALEKFDRYVISNIRPAFYTRYVDDFILVFYDDFFTNYSQIIKDNLSIELKKQNLTLSSEKFKIIKFSKNTAFDFLGYHFRNNLESKLEITISKNKIANIKQKIVKVLKNYEKSSQCNSDTLRMVMQIQNIVFGVITYDNQGHKQRSGLLFDYTLLNKDNQLKLLKKFMYREIKRNKLNKKARQQIAAIANKIENIDLQNNEKFIINYTEMKKEKIIKIIKALDWSYVPSTGADRKRVVQDLFIKIYKKK